jgi:hypothetical protein
MKKVNLKMIGRRELLRRTAPACALACVGLGRAQGLAAALSKGALQETHKFDEALERQFSTRELARIRADAMIRMIRTLRGEMKDGEVIRLLNLTSDEMGREQGAAHAKSVSDPSFENLVAAFRPLPSSSYLSGEVVEDGNKVFEMKVTECVWASIFREAGLDGDIGHAAVCNMDYAYPMAYNPAFRLVRTKTLMQGHDCCNHRYLDTRSE